MNFPILQSDQIDFLPFLTDDDKYKKDLDLDKWYPLQTDVGLLVFTKTAGDFDFELHYECRGYHMVKEWIHGFSLHYIPMLMTSSPTCVINIDVVID